MFNILARTKRRIKKLCEYHTRKANRFEKLAAYYAEKSRQHRTASKAYMDAATTLEIETLDVSDCDWERVLSGDLSERIAAATKRNDEHPRYIPFGDSWPDKSPMDNSTTRQR